MARNLKISAPPRPRRLRDLFDVDGTGLIAGDLPTYDSVTDKFKMDPGSGGSSVVTAYNPTIQDVINTTSRTKVLSVTIPAGTWAENEKIEIDYMAGLFNDTGASRAVTIEVECAGRVIANRTANVSDSFGAGSGDAQPWNYDLNLFSLLFRRQGATDNDAQILYGGYASGDVASAPRNPGGMFTTSSDFTRIDPYGVGDPIDGYPSSQLAFGQHQFEHDFTADIDLDLYVTLAIADPNFWIKIFSARAWKL